MRPDRRGPGPARGTNLLVEVERDYTGYGDETLWGVGKTIRAGLAMQGHDGSDALS